MKAVEKARNLNIEAFRCLLMFLVVLHHSLVRGPWYANGALWTLWFSTFIHWHVDGFVSISGWFGIRFKWQKVVRLWALIAFYWMLFGKGVVVSGGWFGGSYLALMMVAPLLNAAVECLQRESIGKLLGTWGLFAAMMTLTWAPGHLLTGMNANHVDQFSFTTMVFVYVTARVAHVFKDCRWKLSRLILGPLIYFASILFIGGGKTLLQMHRGVSHMAAAWDWLTVYNAPHVWIMAISMLLIFVWYVKLPAWIARVCAFCAPSMFSVYLIHEANPWGHDMIMRIEQWLSSVPHMHPSGVVLLAAVLVFLSCVAIDLVRRFCLSGVRYLCPKLVNW